MENNELHNLSRSELEKLIDELIAELKSRSANVQMSQPDEMEHEATDKSASVVPPNDGCEQGKDDRVNAEPKPQDEPHEDEAGPLSFVPSEDQAKKLLERINYRERYRRTFIGTVASLIIIVAAAIIVSVVLMPVIRVSGVGMDPMYHDGDVLVLFNSRSYTSGQLCCVSWQNKLLIKRIIGMSGDIIDIDTDGNVYINDTPLDEPYVINKNLGECDIEFPYEVPEGQVFIMGDRRDISIDSRSSVVGCVGEEQIIGRILFRIWPLGNN